MFKAVVLALVVGGACALAGEFLIKSEDVLLYRDQRGGVLVLHNPTDSLVEEILITFPGIVQVKEFITHDGVMELSRQGSLIRLTGALLRSGFVQLRWYPGIMLPASAVFNGDAGEWTLELIPFRRSAPVEVRTFTRGSRGAALITRSEGETRSLSLRFSLQVTIVNLVAVGAEVQLEGSGTEFTLSGRFSRGTGIWVEWEPAEAELLAVLWGDREAYTGHWISPGWQEEPLPDGGVRFRAPIAPASQYIWDLGDGTMAFGPEVQHTYPQPGRYLVTLIIREDNGIQHVFQRWINVAGEPWETAGGQSENLPPIADAGGPYGPYDWSEDWQGEWVIYYFTVYFDATASGDPDGQVVQYIWDFGDGSTLTTTSPYVIHRYQVEEGEEMPSWLPETAEGWEPWRIPVSLTVVDDQGASNTATTYVEVYPLWWWWGAE